MTSPPMAIASAQAALREAAREQKRLEFQHRKAARRLMQLADELETALAVLGIKLIIIPTGTDDRKESQP